MRDGVMPLGMELAEPFRPANLHGGTVLGPTIAGPNYGSAKDERDEDAAE